MSCEKKCGKQCHRKTGVTIEQDAFGQLAIAGGKTRDVKRYTLRNENKVEVQIVTYGGTITSLKTPDKNGTVEDIVMGFHTMEGYLGPLNRYFGATIGRCANRIRNAKMTIQGKDYTLVANNNVNHLHGGIKGFDKVIWDDHVEGSKLILSYNSTDMEEGYPGNVLVNATFELTNCNKLRIDYKATTSKITVVNLTNHSYFNLAGHNKGPKELYKHVISINADRITEVGKLSIPTGNLLPVGGTIFDLRIPRTLADVINDVPNSSGFDHNFCVTKTHGQDTAFVLRAVHPDSGRTVELYSNQSGVQFYTSNFLPEDESLQGKNGCYQKHGAFCMETQKYPDSIHHENFPSALLHPGQIYHHVAIFKFGVEK